jgi:hypothetical protein
MRGQTFLSERAKAANLIDRIGSYADAYGCLCGMCEG